MARSSAVLEVVANEEEETLASLMAQLSANYKEQLPIKAKLKPLEDVASELKAKILPLLDAEGIRKTSTKTETVSITEIEGIVIDDLPTMLKAVKKEGFEHIITVKTAQAKEYAQLKGKQIPGTHTEVVSRHLRISAMK